MYGKCISPVAIYISAHAVINFPSGVDGTCPSFIYAFNQKVDLSQSFSSSFCSSSLLIRFLPTLSLFLSACLSSVFLSCFTYLIHNKFCLKKIHFSTFSLTLLFIPFGNKIDGMGIPNHFGNRRQIISDRKENNFGS